MTTWPDPARPGVPLNPERDGWHWLKTGHGVAPWLWRDDPQALTWGMGWETNEEVFAPGDIARVPGTTYLGPVLTPDEAMALQKRVAELEEALRVYECNGKCGYCLGAVRKKYCGRIARAALTGGKDE